MAHDVNIKIKAFDMASAVMGKVSNSVKKMASQVESSAKKVLSGTRTVVGAVVKMGAIATAAGGAAFAYMIAKASEMEETMGKFGVVFGANAESVGKWSQEMADKLGVSRQEMAGMLSGMQDLLVPMGVAEGQATDMSQQMAQLAVDLGSFNNLGTDQVFGDLQAALTGSGEVMKKYGVVLTEAAVKQELLNMGMNPKTADDAAKAQARLNIIMRGTTAAQGDAIRTGGSFANQMKRLRSNISNLAADLGGPLLGGLAKVVQAINSKMGAITAFLQGMIQQAVAFVTEHMDIVRGLGQVLVTVWEMAKNVVGGALSAIVGWIGKGIESAGGFREMMQSAIRGIVTALTFLETVLMNLPTLWQIMADKSSLSMLKLGNDIIHIFTKVLPNAFQSFRVMVGNAFKIVVRETVSLFRRMMDTVISLMDKVASIDPTGIVQAHIEALKKGSQFLDAMQDSVKLGEGPKPVEARRETPEEAAIKKRISDNMGSIGADFVKRLQPRMDALNATFDDSGSVIWDAINATRSAASDLWSKISGGMAQQDEQQNNIARITTPALQASQSRLMAGPSAAADPQKEVAKESKEQSKLLTNAVAFLSDIVDKLPNAVSETKIKVVG